MMALFLLFAASPAAARQLSTGGGADISFVRLFLALLVCLVAAALAILMLRQKMRGGGLPMKLISRLGPTANRLRLVESRRVAPQTDLCLVECDGEDFLLLIAPGSATVLKRSPASAAGAAAQ